jgi:hypothetical protein
MDVPFRDDRVVVVLDQFGAASVRLGTQGDGVSCSCCAEECEQTVDISVSWCGMSVDFSVPVPGFAGEIDSLPDPDESFLQVGAVISCGPCGWFLSILICAYCDETDQFVSEGFEATIPFSESLEDDGTSCPESGEVELVCFGEQFGIPCVTVPTATIT